MDDPRTPQRRIDRMRLLTDELRTRFAAPTWQVTPWRAGVDYWADLVMDATGAVRGVVRSPRHELVDTAYDGVVDFAEVMAKEVAVLELLARHAVPAPALLGWQARRGADAVSWMLLEHVAHDENETLSPGAAHELGTIVARMHALGSQAAGIPGLAPTGSWRALMEGRLGRRLRAAQHYLEVDLPLEDVLDRATRSLAGRDAQAGALLHLDLRPDNICVRSGRIAALLDVSNAMVGDPLLELARLRSSGLLTADFLAGYGTVDVASPSTSRLLDLYELDLAALLTVVAREEMADDLLFAESRAKVRTLCARLTSEP